MFKPARRPATATTTADSYVHRHAMVAAHEVQMALEHSGDAIARVFGLAAEMTRHPTSASAAGAAEIAGAAAMAARFLASAADAVDHGWGGLAASHLEAALDRVERAIEISGRWGTWSAYTVPVVRAVRAADRAHLALGLARRELERVERLEAALDRARRARAA